MPLHWMNTVSANSPSTLPAGSVSDLQQGVLAAWPICLGYLPIGFSFGVLAQQSGLATWQIGLMSVLVFAGGSQFIAVAMIATGASAISIISTTFMVNLRHLLMSSALSVHFPGVSRRFLALFAYGVTDESFAVNLARFREGNWNRFRALALNQSANITWIISTIAGAALGHFIPDGIMGMDYALTAMFICLLVFQIRGAVFVVTALVAAASAVLLYLYLPGNAYIIIASCLAATFGFWIKRIMLRREALR